MASAPLRILGISAHYHDAAAALIEDGRVVAAVQEERFTRRKHDPRFPIDAIRWCLSHADGPLDAVAYYEKPLRKFERILRTAFRTAPFGFRAFCAAMPLWIREKLWIRMQIEDALADLGHDVRDRIFFADHHQSHAASAFYPSPHREAAILTVDGVGEWATTTIAHGRGRDITPLRQISFPHSLGLLYSAFTYYCGFRVNSGEYKLMGLAPYGAPRYVQAIRDHLIDLQPDGSFRLNMDYFGYLRGETMTNRRFETLFGGPPRRPEAPITARECDLARSVQQVIETALLALAREAHRLTHAPALCLAGGVALNCVANGRLLREGPFADIWIRPAAGDAGGALGAALAVHHLHFQRERSTDPAATSMRHAFLGPEFTDAECADALRAAGLRYTTLAPEALAATVARRLAEGAVVGVHAGRAEFGPRALGHRSILADPRRRDMQRTLNLKIKKRESFRPFAPAVLAEHAADYFAIDRPSPFMLITAPVAEKRRLAESSGEPPCDDNPFASLVTVRSEIPAVTHVDHSARIQTVDRESNPRFHRILSAFADLTGCPVLVNTSFNVRGEPPVLTPRDAIECFLATEMDALALGAHFVEKRDVPPALLSLAARRTFQPD
ncbi:MAG: hypothetical protein D6781_02465 [Verrucomicrobia bacterium]|nr:MAG: hypothetical protein D6781_02465 [Verrucomicrobiota bacterium]